MNDLIEYLKVTQRQLGNGPFAVMASKDDTMIVEEYDSGTYVSVAEVNADSL